jgi:hypothetical protein
MIHHSWASRHGALDRHVTASTLAALDLTPADVRRLVPLAVERIGLGGETVYDADDLDCLATGGAE